MAVSPAKKTTSTKKKPAAKKTATTKKAAAKKTTPRRRSTKSPISPEQRYKMTELAAYYIAEQHGFQGNPSDYWIEAETQIAAQLD